MSEGRDRQRHQGASASRYRAWVLRSWTGQCPGDSAELSWRYSLEDPHTGARRGFASLSDLMAYLRAEPEMGGAGSRAADQ
jgi:hypothetical protein